MISPDGTPWFYDAANLWLLVGLFFLMIEALGLPGAGFVFAGIGALAVGALMYVDILSREAHAAPLAVFFIATGISAALLWQPLKKLRLKPGGHYSNMIGDTAYVGSSGLSRQNGGEATWSGTIMKAELAQHAGVDRLEAGTPVIISAVTGATLIVTPKLH